MRASQLAMGWLIACVLAGVLFQVGAGVWVALTDGWWVLAMIPVYVTIAALGVLLWNDRK